MLSEDDPICVKCGGAMTDGFATDYADYNTVRYARWYKGVPKSAIFWEMDPRELPQWRLQGRRCDGCGYVEFFATERAH
jgi:hypothetical protein